MALSVTLIRHWRLASAGTEKSHGKDNFTQVSCTINMKLDAGCINKAQGIKTDIQR